MNDHPVTYGQIKLLPHELGYCRISSTDDAIAYENAPYDAAKILPVANDDAIVAPHHLMIVRRVSVERAIVSESEFDRLVDTALGSDVVRAA